MQEIHIFRPEAPVEFQHDLHSSIHPDARDGLALLRRQRGGKLRRRIAQHGDRPRKNDRIGPQVLAARQSHYGLRTAPLDARDRRAISDPVTHFGEQRIKQPHVGLTERVVLLAQLPVALIAGKTAHAQTIERGPVLHPKTRIKIMPSMTGQMSRHDALLYRPRRTLKPTDGIHEFKSLAQVFPGAGTLQRNEFTVVADVIVHRFVPDQLHARRFDQRHQTVFQSVDFLRSKFDGKVGEAIQMTDAAARAITRLQNRHIASGIDQTFGRRQASCSGSDNNHGSCFHA